MESFFDMEKVKTICKTHGLEFKRRMMYVDEFTVQLLGTVIPHNGGRKGHPIVSQLEERKKDNRKKGRRSPWLETFLTSQMSKDDIKTKAKDAVAAVKDLEEEIKPFGRMLLTS
ncbi:hypothetical protein BGX31_009047 [Mortierella sp. GBA43]|nr:hypothetical protein BGX31_009047 [Mortierella sp. GBA43]